MWIVLFSISIVCFRVDAFINWNLHELQEPSTTFTQPKNVLKVTPFLRPSKDWKKVRDEAVVKPFAGDVKSYAGFFTVNQTSDSNMYFWFFPCEKEPKKAPLILWLHGGPGQSSMMGLFEESGPYKIVNGKATLRETSWTKHYNVIYLDNPIGAGFSYTQDSGGYSKTIEHAVDNLYEAVTQFYKMFPEYKENAFYMVGQSYGGKYIPVLTTLIHKKNNEQGNQKINLKGMMIGCGCLDPVNQIAFSKYLYEHGVVDLDGRHEVMNNEERTKSFLYNDDTRLATGPIALIWYKMTQCGYKDPLDVNDPDIDLKSYDAVEEFVTREDVRKEIHVGDAEFHDKKVVMWYFWADLLNSVRPQLSKVMQLGYKVLLFSGQYDMVIPHEQIDRVIAHLDWTGLQQFHKAKVQPWYSHGELAGYKKSYANLQQVFVRKANHMIVRSQQKWMLELLKSFAV